MAQGQVLYEKQGRVITRRVFFSGSGALYKGMGLCYDRDRGTAANVDGSRDQVVELPTSSNNLNFAGVITHDAPAKTGGQWIEIAEPGSIVEVAIGKDTVINTGRITCSCSTGDAGRFSEEGHAGRGSAIPLQTNASGVLAEQRDGGTDAFDSTGLILTAADTGTLAVGDWIFILAGEDDGTNAVTPTAGPHVITALTEDTSITIGTSQADGGTMEATWYGMSGNQTALCYLEDGNESGLQQWITPANGAITTPMVGGVTRLHGGFTPSADSTFTLADGVRMGQRKTFWLTGALTTNDFLVTVTSGVQLDGSTALATFEMDGSGDTIVLEWGTDTWRVIHMTGTAVA